MFSSIPSRSFNQCHFFRLYLSLNIWERPRCVGDHSIQQICNFRFFINILSCDFLLIPFSFLVFASFVASFFVTKVFFLINSIYVSVKSNKRRKKGAKAIMRISWFLELVVTIIQWNLFFFSHA